jgi:hypothetical protein
VKLQRRFKDLIPQLLDHDSLPYFREMLSIQKFL